MPLFDHVDNVAYPIAKLYDEVDGTKTPIYEVYDNVGTEYELIYRAEEVLFPEQYSIWAKGVGGDSGSHTATVNSSKIHLISDFGHEGSYSNASKAYAYTPVIDFSQFNKLTVTYNRLATGSEYGTHATCKIGILNSTSVTVYNNNGCTEQGANAWIWSQSYSTNGKNESGTVSYNITNVKSKARLWFLVYSYLTYGEMNITKVVLE